MSIENASCPLHFMKNKSIEMAQKLSLHFLLYDHLLWDIKVCYNNDDLLPGEKNIEFILNFQAKAGQAELPTLSVHVGERLARFKYTHVIFL